MGIKVPCGGFELGGGLSFQNGVVTNGVKTLRLEMQPVLGGGVLLYIMPNSDIQNSSDLITTDLIAAEIYSQYEEKGETITQLEYAFSALPGKWTIRQGWNDITINRITDSNVGANVYVLKIDEDNSSGEEIVFALTRTAVVWSTSSSGN